MVDREREYQTTTASGLHHLKWQTDAEFIHELDISHVFTNPQIESFLNAANHNKFIVVASKGMGKTLLLRHKRQAIEQGRQGILTIPKGQQCDFVRLPPSLSTKLIVLMTGMQFWYDLWHLSISISVIVNYRHELDQSRRERIGLILDQAFLPKILQQEIEAALDGNKNHSQFYPSEVLNIFLNSGITVLQRARRALQIVGSLLNTVSSGVFVFIDSFDQALNRFIESFHESQELDNDADWKIWCRAQSGLLKAAWDISRHNHHIKVYASIRQEAYAEFKDPDKINIIGSVLLIEYSKQDLESIFKKAIKQFDGKQSIGEFVGLNEIKNGAGNQKEAVFDYIYRHIIAVPRWLIVLGEKISDSTNGREYGISKVQRANEIRDIVNRTSALILASEYLRGEMKLFFRGVDPDQWMDELVYYINSSVLTYHSILRISNRFNEQPAFSCLKNPFSLLFNLGLLGYVERIHKSKTRLQRFRKPYEFEWHYEEIIPQDPQTFFLLHPAMHYLVSTKKPTFHRSRVKIEDQKRWTRTHDNIVNQNRLKILISYDESDHSIAKEIADVVENNYVDNAYVDIFEIFLNPWQQRQNKWVASDVIDVLYQAVRNGQLQQVHWILLVSTDMITAGLAEQWAQLFDLLGMTTQAHILPILIDDLDRQALPPFMHQFHLYQGRSPAQTEEVAADIVTLQNAELENQA